MYHSRFNLAMITIITKASRRVPTAKPSTTMTLARAATNKAVIRRRGKMHVVALWVHILPAYLTGHFLLVKG